MYKHVVITGGAGFVGSNLVHEMARRYPDADLTAIIDLDHDIACLANHRAVRSKRASSPLAATS